MSGLSDVLWPKHEFSPTAVRCIKHAKDLRPGDLLEGDWAVEAVLDEQDLIQVRISGHGNYCIYLRPNDLVRCLALLATWRDVPCP